jgi:hypothetical protein
VLSAIPPEFAFLFSERPLLGAEAPVDYDALVEGVWKAVHSRDFIEAIWVRTLSTKSELPCGASRERRDELAAGCAGRGDE